MHIRLCSQCENNAALSKAVWNYFLDQRVIDTANPGLSLTTSTFNLQIQALYTRYKQAGFIMQTQAVTKCWQ